MRTVSVELGANAYPIFIGSGLLENAGVLLSPVLPQKRVIIVTDSRVGPRYADGLCASLEREGVTSDIVTLEAGESTKSFPSFAHLLESLLGLGPERQTTLLALGGGVIGDITGFAASVLLRGVPFVQVPTTLLAQVDSSVGGKTAINSAHGKNLIGTFYQPRAVLADVETLESLPERELLAGYAEVVKYGLLGDAGFFSWLEVHGQTLLAGNQGDRVDAIEASCRMKARIVEADEKEAGKRALLNLGHTFGHALEKETGYSDLLLHGEAVALGMLMALRLSVKKGWCLATDAERVQEHFEQVGLPTRLGSIPHAWDPARLASYCAQDKKVQQGRLRFVALRGIGEAFLTDEVSMEDAEEVFRVFV